MSGGIVGILRELQNRNEGILRKILNLLYYPAYYKDLKNFADYYPFRIYVFTRGPITQFEQEIMQKALPLGASLDPRYLSDPTPFKKEDRLNTSDFAYLLIEARSKEEAEKKGETLVRALEDLPCMRTAFKFIIA